MDPCRAADLCGREPVSERLPNPVVHLELHTGNLARAWELYARLFGWQAERVAAAGREYHAITWGGGISGGGVECGTTRPLWLPYVEVGDVHASTERACGLGAIVLLEPREGPAGWRSVVEVPDGAEIAFWQPKPAARGRRTRR
jgi:predicted enzyme related to lactoylglutathione lyase